MLTIAFLIRRIAKTFLCMIKLEKLVHWFKPNMTQKLDYCRKYALIQTTNTCLVLQDHLFTWTPQIFKSINANMATKTQFSWCDYILINLHSVGLFRLSCCNLLAFYLALFIFLWMLTSIKPQHANRNTCGLWIINQNHVWRLTCWMCYCTTSAV